MTNLPASMPAIWYERTGPARDVLIRGERPTPRPAADEVVVRVAASGINPHDTKRRSGWIGRETLDRPVIPHGDGSGVIAAVGRDVSESRLGEAVWFHHCGGTRRPGEGSLAAFCALPERQALPLPVGVDFARGAGLGVPGLTAHDAVFAQGSVAGKTLLVTGGAGAVAGYAIGLAKRDGARVIATTSSPAKAEQARAFGADQVIDYRREDVAGRVMEMTDGVGVDRIVEVDFGANLVVSKAVIRNHGVIASYSSSRVREPLLPYYDLAPKAVTIRIVQGLILPIAAQDAAVRDLTQACAEGRLVHPPAVTFAFAEAAAAHEWLESGAGIGKAVVLVAN